jgi:hypothetical protein
LAEIPVIASFSGEIFVQQLDLLLSCQQQMGWCSGHCLLQEEIVSLDPGWQL